MSWRRMGVLAISVSLAACATAEGHRSIEVGAASVSEEVRLHYKRAGRTPAKVIAPGGLFLEPWLQPLEKRFAYLAYDPRGRGQSSRPANLALFGAHSDVEDIEVMRRQLGAERVTLVGWSYLAGVVAAYAIAYPEHVERIVLIGPAPFDFSIRYSAASAIAPVDTAEAARLLKLRREGLAESQPREFCLLQNQYWVREMTATERNATRLAGFVERTCASPNEWPVNFFPVAERISTTYGQLHLSPEVAATITVPVLVVHGERDRNASIGAGTDWAYYLPNARLLSVPDAAHLIVGEVPSVVAEIGDFIDGSWPAKAIKPRGPAERVSTASR